jgi:MoaA/NifB/PqqE/SkfB family radical SAM enzyme
VIEKKEEVSECFRELIREFFKTRKPKNWFRAYFNHGLINYVNGGERLLPCRMGEDIFLVDPYGEIYPCNVLPESMGNLADGPFEKVWNSPRAAEARKKARACGKNCWMIGSASPAIKKNKWAPIKWILKNKWNY